MSQGPSREEQSRPHAFGRDGAVVITGTEIVAVGKREALSIDDRKVLTVDENKVISHSLELGEKLLARTGLAVESRWSFE